jgi:phage terminase large subunit-like protein
VEQGKFRTCEEQKLLVQMVRRVFETETLKIDAAQVEKYLSYQKYFPFALFAWEVFCFVLHNCVFKTDGTPRWSVLFVLMGRGGGKNGYLSFEDFCLITETNGVAYYDIDICANSEEQAKTSFDEIYNILEDPKWNKLFKKHFRWTKTEIQNIKTRSKIKYRTNNPKGKDGLRSGKVDFDEPHAYENWENINVFTTGLGKKPHPRRTYVSTNGDVRDGPLDQLIEKSKKILNGEIPDNGFLPFICKLDNEDEVNDPDNWEKANPSLPYLPTLKEQMKQEYADYQLDPVINNAFMTKRMNIPQGRKDTEVASWENILRTNEEIPDMTGKSCVLGIDFSKTTDFVSAFLLFKEKENYYGIHHSWFCTASNDKHRIKIPLDQMAERGLLTIVNDVEINPDLIAQWVDQQKYIYNIEKIAIDSYRYSLLSRALREVGFDATDKAVKLVRPSDIMFVQPKIHSMFVGGKLKVGDDPLFRWGVNNTKLIPAPNGNFKYDKIEPKSRKTDMFMAFVAAMTLEDELPEAVDFEALPVILL